LEKASRFILFFEMILDVIGVIRSSPRVRSRIFLLC